MLIRFLTWSILAGVAQGQFGNIPSPFSGSIANSSFPPFPAPTIGTGTPINGFFNGTFGGPTNGFFNVTPGGSFGSFNGTVLPAFNFTNTKTTAPTNVPSIAPVTAAPTNTPRITPITLSPTDAPTAAPVTLTPTSVPTAAPVTLAPTSDPTSTPTAAPVTLGPTDVPTALPAILAPTNAPTASPVTRAPSNVPTVAPVTLVPTDIPTAAPITLAPTNAPTAAPVTMAPTDIPTASPLTLAPTNVPTATPITLAPTNFPTVAPVTAAPVLVTTAPVTPAPSHTPTIAPRNMPTAAPVTAAPIPAPTNAPTRAPTNRPTNGPTLTPTNGPTRSLTSTPSKSPIVAADMPTSAPQEEFVRQEARFESVSIALEGSTELDATAIASFEITTKTWFQEFYNGLPTNSNQRKLAFGDGLDGVRAVNTTVTFVSQQALPADPAANRPLAENTIVYTQEITYFSQLSIAPVAEELIVIPYQDTEGNVRLVQELQSSGDVSYQSLLPPIALLTVAPPTNGPTNAPTTIGRLTTAQAFVEQEARFESVSLTLEGVTELDTAAIATFESVIKSWFQEYYNGLPTDSNQRKLVFGDGVEGVRVMVTTVIVVSQQVLPADPAASRPLPVTTIVYIQEISYDAQPSIAPDAAQIIVIPFEDSEGNTRLVQDLQSSGVQALVLLVPPIASPIVTPPPVGGDDGLSGGAIAGIVIGASVLLSAAAYGGFLMMDDGRGDGGGYVDPNTRPPSAFNVSATEDLSTIQGDATQKGAGDASLAEYGDQSVDTMDFDYSKAYGGRVDTSDVSSAGGTFGDNTRQSMGDAASGTVAARVALGTGVDSESGFATNVKEEVLIIDAPPGKLGAVIDTPDDGAPIVHAVKDSSVIADQIRVGDKLVAVDDEDVRSMTAIQVSKLISRKSANPSRKLTVVRTSVVG